MKHLKLLLLALISSSLFSSCEDFIERDLSKRSLVVNSPTDNTVSALFSQTFWWEELKGADKYQIQIVKPSFASLQQFVVDTSVSGSMVVLTLAPGTYQWRIRAKNSTSATEYITRTLTIDSTLDLSGQSLMLSLPADDHYTNQLSNTFSWQTMPNAESYVFQLLQDGSPIHTQSGNITSFSYTVNGQGTYEWRAFAQNTTSNSAYFTRSFTVDTAKPAVPTVVFPVTDTVTAEPVQLQWSSAESGLTYRLQLSTDSTFSVIGKDTVTDNTVYAAYNLLQGQYYYWRVKAIDKALNESAYFFRRRIKKN